MSSSNSSPVVAPAQVSFSDVVNEVMKTSAAPVAVPAPSTLANTESEPESESFASAVVDSTGKALAQLLFETYFTESTGKTKFGSNAARGTSVIVGGIGSNISNQNKGSVARTVFN